MAVISGSFDAIGNVMDESYDPEMTFGALSIGTAGTFIAPGQTTNINASSRFDGSASVFFV